jgi:endonuclease/exonuclease/phosphatase (EEP) superfamily protein YafD
MSQFHRYAKPAFSLSVISIATVFGMLFVGLVNVPAFSQTHYTMNAYLRCTRDDTIMKAFSLMGAGRGEASLNRIVNKPMRVIFKDLKTMHKALKNYDALSWISNQGEEVIFINEKHRNAPPEALAALISHEAMHDDEYNSLSEEVHSWQHEAAVWIELKAKNPGLAKIPQGTFPLVDRENRIEAEFLSNNLEQFVRSSPGYQKLPETSPGYTANTAFDAH